MKYRTLIKQRFPKVEGTLRRSPMLMRVATKVESQLIKRDLKRTAKLFKGKADALDYDELQLMEQAKQAGLFDYQWYCETQRHQFNSEAEAFGDYLHKSTFSSASPSPAFDNLMYQKHNLDVYHASMSPLAHYLAAGQKEGRIVQPFTPKWTPTDKLNIKPNLELCKKQKVAVCLHIFYADFIDYYAQCLKSFPTSVDLYISVSDIATKAEIDTKLASLETVNKVSVVEVPNRGRNFGPLLVEFGQELLNYDLFCHLHSKKSLYSGREQTQWADYLGEYLLKDTLVISKMLSYMELNQDCGVYYPTSFSMMPDWVNHWLKNKPFRGEFYEEWGIEDDSEFISYPVGGMFWARPAALMPLLSKQYSYDDFPKEPLPNDGSPLHALERVIGLLAEKSGYSQLFYHPELGQFTHDKSYVFANYVNSPDALLHKIQPFETISFDVFDTLVRRSHHVPDYAKLKLGQYLVGQGVIDNAIAFVTQRNQAEYEVRKAKDFKGDVSLSESYDRLAQTLNWSSEQAQQYAELEFNYDLDMIESKDEIVDILNTLIGQGKQVFIVSDTYYNEHQIVLMLRKAGVTNGYKLFVSSELGFRKDNGTMWSHVSGLLKDKTRFVHVGDNAVADAQIPGDFGLANLHILHPTDKWQAAGWSNPFSGENSLNEQQIIKWGPIVSQFGRYPFLGE
jgi:FMN phosphatase YigB (HAD superfamily)